jgi:hypothetical protein
MKWPWSDQTHLTSYHVDELRDLVDVKEANNLTETRNPRIISMRCPLATSGRFHIRIHRSELEHHEAMTIFADPFLPKEGWPPRFQSDCEHDQKIQW